MTTPQGALTDDPTGLDSLGPCAPDFRSGSMEVPAYMFHPITGEPKVALHVHTTLALNEVACELGKGFFYHGSASTSMYGDIFYEGLVWGKSQQDAFRDMSHSQRLAKATALNGEIGPRRMVIGMTVLPERFLSTTWEDFGEEDQTCVNIRPAAGVLFHFYMNRGNPILVAREDLLSDATFEAGPTTTTPTGFVRPLKVRGQPSEQHENLVAFSNRYRVKDYAHVVQQMFEFYCDAENADDTHVCWDEVVDNAVDASALLR
ncbi:MAG: hypothetical protein M1819_005159 [Sarea resinae]|nr:MAG: hypothetical protein M1819_005159 [Sarea resinae]